MDFWKVGQFQAAAGGQWLLKPGDPDQVLGGLGTDSRSIQSGQAFIVLRGERFDGHDYAGAAADAGAALLIVSREDCLATLGKRRPAVLLVPDTLGALHRLAHAYRDVLWEAGVKVIAVTGSNGKTTTRHLVHTALSAVLKGTQSPKSFNNHIGLPLTLLAASTSDDFVVAEIGTNHPGEIAPLARIARPDVAVITNIGTSHIGQFGSREAIAAEKASLLHHVCRGGLVVVSCADAGTGTQPRCAEAGLPLLASHLAGLPADMTVMRFGEAEGCDVRLTHYDQTDRGSRCGISTNDRQIKVILPLLGRHNAHNALAAIAVADRFKLDVSVVAKALARAKPLEMRMRVQEYGPANRRLVVLLDAYNANPESVEAALRVLADHPRLALLPRLPPSRPQGRRVVILGDMLELGDAAREYHRRIGEFIGSLGGPVDTDCRPRIDLVILIGKLSLDTRQALGRQWPHDCIHAYSAWSDDLPVKVAQLLEPGDMVLIKASRAMALERLVPAISRVFSS